MKFSYLCILTKCRFLFMMLRKLIIRIAVLLLCCWTGVCGYAQSYTLENKFTMPLTDVFKAMEEKYEVKLHYSDELVEGKEVVYGLYLFKPDFLQTLDIVLATQGLDYTINADGSYKIKVFEYARRRPEEGVERLRCLEAVYGNLSEWEERKAVLKECLSSTIGVAALQDKLVGRMTVAGLRKKDGYTVANYALEVLPGVYATGSVYRPAKVKRGEKLPFILNPNGHFLHGRYNKDLQTGCAMLAKMGAVVVSVDLLGYGESQLAVDGKDHRNSVAITLHALQNKALLDYFCAQPDIDLNRIAVTGASGGGSQTMFLTALDDRVCVSAPVIMVSSYFMGGCGCESGLPIGWCGGGTNLAEIAAMAAPRSMLIVSDGRDWTQQVDQYEYPFIKRTYGFYGKESSVYNVHLSKEKHDYGPSKRFAVYEFMARELGLNTSAVQDRDGNWDESKVKVEKEDEMKFFGPNGERFPADAVKGIEELVLLVEELKK